MEKLFWGGGVLQPFRPALVFNSNMHIGVLPLSETPRCLMHYPGYRRYTILIIISNVAGHTETICLPGHLPGLGPWVQMAHGFNSSLPSDIFLNLVLLLLFVVQLFELSTSFSVCSASLA